MRAGAGLLALLIGIGLLAWLWATHTATVAKKGEEARQQIQPMTGHDANGVRAEDSVKFEGQMSNGNLRSLLVTDVTPGGFYEEYFGLKKGDQITQIGGNDVAVYGDEGAAASFVYQAGQGQPLTVLRNGQKLTLNSTDGTLGGHSTASTPAATPRPAAPSTPAPSARPASPPANGNGNGNSGGTVYPGAPGIRIPQIPQPSPTE